jgi:hypothetical protein
MTTKAITPLRQRMIEDMNARKLCAGTQRGHIRSCKRAGRERREGLCQAQQKRCGDAEAICEAVGRPIRPRARLGQPPAELPTALLRARETEGATAGRMASGTAACDREPAGGHGTEKHSDGEHRSASGSMEPPIACSSREVPRLLHQASCPRRPVCGRNIGSLAASLIGN